MAKLRGQKIKLMKLAEIFRKYTDEDHALTADELCEKLSQAGINAERKAIYDDVECLMNNGFDIVHSNSNPKGYFLASREFELPEIYLLADAVSSANFISAKKSRELISKLDGMLSISQASRRKKNIFFDSRTKCENEELFYLIDGINTAIEQNRKIKFVHSKRVLDENKAVVWEEKEFKISPYAMAWRDDCYYLIGNHEKYDNLMHLRIDRMHSLEITDEKSRSFREVSGYTDVFDTADYISKLFQMYAGTVQKVKLKCNISLLEPILDRFTEDIFITGFDGESFSFSADVAVSEAFISWVLGFGDKIEVLSPVQLRQRTAERARQILAVYGGL